MLNVSDTQRSYSVSSSTSKNTIMTSPYLNRAVRCVQCGSFWPVTCYLAILLLLRAQSGTYTFTPLRSRSFLKYMEVGYNLLDIMPRMKRCRCLSSYKHVLFAFTISTYNTFSSYFVCAVVLWHVWAQTQTLLTFLSLNIRRST